MGNIRHAEAIGKRKLNAGDDFRWYRYECIGPDAIKLTGCIVTSVYASGPRKGRPKFDGAPQTCVVTDEEQSREFASYENETGLCGECYGSGQEIVRVDHSGAQYRACRVCDGTAKAKVSA